jgi:hypothetical protein
MSGNTAPIFSKVGTFQGNATITTAAADYTGISPYNARVFQADATNGGYIQRLRFKSIGTNNATVARIFISPPNTAHLASLLTTPSAPTGTPSATGGTILAGTFYARIAAADSVGAWAPVGNESTVVTTTGTTSSISWTWTAVPGATTYRIYVAQTTAGSESGYFNSATNTFNQTVPLEGAGWNYGIPTASNNYLYDEVSLPATNATTTAATPSIDLPMGFALPPGYEIYVGLGASVAAGWQVTSIGGAY